MPLPANLAAWQARVGMLTPQLPGSVVAFLWTHLDTARVRAAAQTSQLRGWGKPQPTENRAGERAGLGGLASLPFLRRKEMLARDPGRGYINFAPRQPIRCLYVCICVVIRVIIPYIYQAFTVDASVRQRPQEGFNPPRQQIGWSKVNVRCHKVHYVELQGRAAPVSPRHQSNGSALMPPLATNHTEL